MEKAEVAAERFKALSDPTRLRLIRLLAEHKGALCVNALAGRLGVSQPAVSQHLRVLRQAGLVRGERQGYRVHYQLSESGMQQAVASLQAILLLEG